MSDTLESTLLEKEAESILLSLVSLDKDKLLLSYLNNDGRMALFESIIKEYPIKRVQNRVVTTLLVYNLVKSMRLSRPLQILSEIFETSTTTINARVQSAKAKGYCSEDVVKNPLSFEEAKKQYIEAMSA
jgi:hypothetical protein